MFSDFRFAFRPLAKSPGFTLVAILALALGIGANTAIFSVVHGVVLRSLPLPEQERLLYIGEWSEQVPQMSVSYPNFVDWRARQKAFTAIGAARFQGFNYVGKGEAERITGSMASHDLFQALGVAPIRGRLYGANEDKPGVERAVLLSERIWKRTFGGRDTIVGEKIQLGDEFYTVVGVMPASFQYPSPTVEVWVPLGLFADQYTDRGSHPGIYCVARLKPGVSYEAGVADMKAIAQQLAEEHRDSNAHQSVSIQPLTQLAYGSVQTPLYILLGAAGFVLLIACANVANLQLARAHARSREFAVRAALGASRGRIIRQLLAESVLLGGLGCVFGVLLGVWGLDGLRSILPSNVPRINEVSLNGAVLGFAIAASLITSVVFGLVPALHAAKQDLRETLSQGTRVGGAASGNNWRAALIIGEFALTCVLLVGAGLMIRTLANLYRADPGYSVERTLTFNWTIPDTAYKKPEQRVSMLKLALERLAATPGVKSVGFISPLPLTGGGNQNSYYVEGTPVPELGRQPTTEYFQTSGSVFTTLQIPLRSGRVFGPADTLTSPKVAVVDTMFVEKNFHGQDPIGKRFTYGSRPPKKDSDWITIIGVVAHIQNYGLGQDTREQTYVPYSQRGSGAVTFTVRTEQTPSAITASIRSVMHEFAPDLPVYGVRTMEEFFTTSISTQRLTVFLLGTFAALALLLATLGLYGVLAYNVGQRTREIGVRMALGATQSSVVALILRHGLKFAALGLVIGLLAAIGLSRLLKTVLYEVSPFDLTSFGAVAIVLTMIGVFACWLPARRATKIDPVAALRAE
jgi:putative ABC transport system permease protein